MKPRVRVRPARHPRAISRECFNPCAPARKERQRPQAAAHHFSPPRPFPGSSPRSLLRSRGQAHRRPKAGHRNEPRRGKSESLPSFSVLSLPGRPRRPRRRLHPQCPCPQVQRRRPQLLHPKQSRPQSPALSPSFLSRSRYSPAPPPHRQPSRRRSHPHRAPPNPRSRVGSRISSAGLPSQARQARTRPKVLPSEAVPLTSPGPNRRRPAALRSCSALFPERKSPSERLSPAGAPIQKVTGPDLELPKYPPSPAGTDLQSGGGDFTRLMRSLEHPPASAPNVPPVAPPPFRPEPLQGASEFTRVLHGGAVRDRESAKPAGVAAAGSPKAPGLAIAPAPAAEAPKEPANKPNRLVIVLLFVNAILLLVLIVIGILLLHRR